MVYVQVNLQSEMFKEISISWTVGTLYANGAQVVTHNFTVSGHLLGVRLPWEEGTIFSTSA